LTPPARTDAGGAPRAADRPWWRDAVVYQTYVRSFADANGDGIGDLDGIGDRLEYLSELGVDAIWLTPCYPSPQRDHGYDVADYVNIEPDYGDLASFDALVDAARGLGMHVLMDIVANHCSDHHAWFRAAVESGRDSVQRRRFYFADGRGRRGDEPPNNWRASFGGPAWTRITEPDGRPGQWYLHTFTPWQPDFNWNNDEVAQHFDEVLRFWFDRGVDGFRADAVSWVGKAPGLPDAPAVSVDVPESAVAGRNPYTSHRPEGHVVWRRWRALVNDYEARHPGRDLLLVAEAYAPHRPDRLLEYVRPDEFHQAFSFDLLLSPWNIETLRAAIIESVDTLAAAGAALTWTLNNHDTHRCVTRYGRADATTTESWTGSNLVNSNAPVDAAVGTRRARAAALMVLGLPGAAYLYQGEELGLPEVLDVAARQDPIFFNTDGREVGRDGCRIPLPWTDDPVTNFGFSSSDAPSAPWLAQPLDWGVFSAAGQRFAADSMLRLYRRAIALRRTHLDGQPFALVEIDRRLLAWYRGSALVVVNPGPDDVPLTSPVTAGRHVILSSDAGRGDDDAPVGSPAVIPADTAWWFTSAK
jgi:alpha-glucosidase